jgi:fibro-slime domain-containing protein
MTRQPKIIPLDRLGFLAAGLGAALTLMACSGPVPMGTNGEGGAAGSDDSDQGGARSPIISSIPTAAGGNGGSSSGTACKNELQVVFRDFRGWEDASGPRHSDFQGVPMVGDKGLVDPQLGSDQKPIYAHGSTASKTVANADSFSQWYRDTEGVNQRVEATLPLTSSATDTSLKIYDSANFFPLDGKGWGNQGQTHNFSFTTEIHTVFAYKGGESFTFKGDDDVFVYLDNKLVIDLGGVHNVLTGTVKMDDQGLTKDQTYALDIFHAERHTSKSNFRMETRFECLTSIIIP